MNNHDYYNYSIEISGQDIQQGYNKFITGKKCIPRRLDYAVNNVILRQNSTVAQACRYKLPIYILYVPASTHVRGKEYIGIRKCGPYTHTRYCLYVSYVQFGGGLVIISAASFCSLT